MSLAVSGITSMGGVGADRRLAAPVSNLRVYVGPETGETLSRRTTGGGAVPDRILIVEDELAIADAMRFSLRQEGFETEHVADGAQAARLPLDRYDVVVLDLVLPGLSGFDVCRRIRDRSTVPIIVVSARSAEADVVRALEIGADDYVSKPFSMAELMGRVRATVRRRDFYGGGGGPTVLDLEGLRLDLVEHAVTVDGRRVELTPSEFRLLSLLASSPGRAFTRREIVEHVWHSTFAADERSCDTHVKNLRRKLEPMPAEPQRLVSVRGVGYMLRTG
jgi:two-component system, OmpR family, response regulator RegX3